MVMLLLLVIVLFHTLEHSFLFFVVYQLYWVQHLTWHGVHALDDQLCQQYC